MNKLRISLVRLYLVKDLIPLPFFFFWKVHLCDAPPDGNINYLVIDPTAYHPSHIPPRHDLRKNHFSRNNKKTAAEDFTKSMGLRDNNGNIIQQY
jgi:hypothetical protein